MIVICPKCRVKLKIADEKVSPEGTRFKCPKCTTILMVKRPASKIRERQDNLVLVAHGDNSVIEKVSRILEQEGYQVITATNGIDAMVKSLREHPFLALIDVALPKIYGFEVCKRIKERKETSDVKVILITSVYDRSRYRRPPSSIYGADDYIDEPELEERLSEKIRQLLTKEEAPPEKEAPPSPPTEETREKESVQGPVGEKVVEEAEDADIKRARRLVRTILSDIALYNPKQVEEAIERGTFRETFQTQLKEGMKLYQLRIPQEVRQKGDFFNEEIERFIEEKKRNLMK
ncbi:MAG TPA: response regulator [Nitrospirae bacterium]|nr:response regulator [Nitrospirota bacterium]